MQDLKQSVVYACSTRCCRHSSAMKLTPCFAGICKKSLHGLGAAEAWASCSQRPSLAPAHPTCVHSSSSSLTVFAFSACCSMPAASRRSGSCDWGSQPGKQAVTAGVVGQQAPPQAVNNRWRGSKLNSRQPQQQVVGQQARRQWQQVAGQQAADVERSGCGAASWRRSQQVLSNPSSCTYGCSGGGSQRGRVTLHLTQTANSLSTALHLIELNSSTPAFIPIRFSPQGCMLTDLVPCLAAAPQAPGLTLLLQGPTPALLQLPRSVVLLLPAATSLQPHTQQRPTASCACVCAAACQQRQ